MSQARPMAWWRQARNDLDLAAVASHNAFNAQACFPTCPCGLWRA
jgi:hypothetical protein